MKKIILITALFSITAKASPIPDNKNEFCSRFGTTTEERETVLLLAGDPINLLTFKNQGGLFKSGVCWWHSRFQRNLLYLSLFRPDLPKLTKETDLKDLIHQIRQGKSIVTVPGFFNVAEFTGENQKLIQKELNDWQLYDGLVLGKWIDGLKGRTKTEAAILKKMMADDYNYITVQKKVGFFKLQITGLPSHSWLVTNMRKTRTGYDIGFIDSNTPQMSRLYTYQEGDESFFIKNYGNFVPYLEFINEEERLIQVGKVFCGLQKLLPEDDHFSRDYYLDLKSADKNY